VLHSSHVHFSLGGRETTMKTVFVGGGTGCRDVLEMALQHRLATLSL